MSLTNPQSYPKLPYEYVTNYSATPLRPCKLNHIRFYLEETGLVTMSFIS